MSNYRDVLNITELLLEDEELYKRIEQSVAEYQLEQQSIKRMQTFLPFVV